MKYSGILTTLSLIATVAASPLENTKRDDSLMYPYRTYRYWVQTGEMKEDPQDQLLVVKNNNPADSTTAIVTFNFDESVQDKTCKLLFDLLDRDVSTGSQNVDVFSIIDPPGSQPQAVSDDASRALALQLTQSRGQQLGRIHVTAPGEADWIMSFHGYPEFPCPAGQLMGVEFVGVGDAVTMRWDIGVTGPRVQVL